MKFAELFGVRTYDWMFFNVGLKVFSIKSHLTLNFNEIFAKLILLSKEPICSSIFLHTPEYILWMRCVIHMRLNFDCILNESWSTLLTYEWMGKNRIISDIWSYLSKNYKLKPTEFQIFIFNFKSIPLFLIYFLLADFDRNIPIKQCLFIHKCFVLVFRFRIQWIWTISFSSTTRRSMRCYW